MDEIRIRGLKIFANHGVYDAEKANGQEFVLNITMYTDIHEAAKNDDISKTINYAETCEFIKREFTTPCYDLIEAAAEHVARGILLKYESCREVEVEVCKPHAPIIIPFDNVSVCIRRGKHTAYISVGSNIGDGPENIKKARNLLLSSPRNRLLGEATLITTKPYGKTDQADFTNGLWKIETLLTPNGLLDRLHEIEETLGRVRAEHWGPRTIDLDLIYYDDLVMDSEYLTLPHYDMHNREFVLAPLAEVDAYVRHPVNHMLPSEMLEKLKK